MPASDLENLIQVLATRGDLNHLSLLALPGGQWQATYLDANKASGYSMATAKEPVEALRLALTQRRSN